MASTSSPPECGITDFHDDLGKLKEIREEIGDEGKFRRMCESESKTLGFNVLHLAAGMGVLDVCSFLVDEVGVDVDVRSDRGEFPLLIAVGGGHFVIAKYFIDCGADVTKADDKGITTLHCCIQHGDTEIMALLLTKGADINADSVGGTPLHGAARLGCVGVVDFLLQNKAEPNLVSIYLGIPPLGAAIYSNTNTVECVQLLLKAGADPNQASNGFSPLTLAVEQKSNSCINSLLAAGADVDSVSSSGMRPIQHAAWSGNVEAVWMLILARPWILATPNLTFRDMFKAMNFFEAEHRKYIYSKDLKEKGNNAWDRQDYPSAIVWYSEAIYHNPRDEKLWANRSLCWARLGKGGFALHDAEQCAELKPDWARAHFRVAVAWHILKGYQMSSDAFKRAFELAPETEKIER